MSPPCESGISPRARTLAERLDPRIVLLCAVLFVTVEVATPIQEWWRFLGYGVVLTAALIICGVRPDWLPRRLIFVLPFIAGVVVSLFVLRPAADDAIRVPVLGLPVSGALLWLLASVTAKGLLSVGALSLPVALWDFATLLRALQALRVPRLFVMLMGFMWRYFYLLADEVGRMTQARDARGPEGRLVRRALVTGDMVGTLFLRSYERAERVGQAMVARGYDGAIRMLTPLRPLRWLDVGLLASVAALVVVLRLV